MMDSRENSPLSAYRKFAEKLPDWLATPQWFKQVQRDLAQVSEEVSYPKIARIDWPDWELIQDFNPSEISLDRATDPTEGRSQGSASFSGRIIQRGGQTIWTSLSKEAQEKGLIICPLFKALSLYPDLLQDYLFQLNLPCTDALTAHHISQLMNGVFIYVPEGLVLNKAIEVVIEQDGRYSQTFHSHVLIVAGPHSQFDYIERLVSDGQEAMTATFYSEVFLGEGAQMKYIALDRLKAASQSYLKRHGRLGQHARLSWAVAAMNDGDVIVDLQTILQGQGSETDLSVIGISDGDQQQIIDSKVINQACHSQANIYQHGVVLDQGRLSFNAIGHIEKKAKEANAQQESRLMILSDRGRGDANPILLIDEFEVMAGHAASVGHVDPEKLWYLMSRGLDRTQAEFMMIQGFLGHVIQALPNEALRQEMQAVISEKLAMQEAMKAVKAWL